MATTKQRINITADRDVEIALRAAAKRDHVPVASKAAELLRFALEIEEDLTLGELMLERDTKDVKYIPHDEFWRKVYSKNKK